MLTKSLAKELSKYNIRINSVNPGIVDTGFQVNNKLLNTEEYLDFLNKMKNKYPLGIGKTTDISNLVMFLASKEAKWITGCNYIIDGGFSSSN
jgi:Dehydrogenases with different specificities (related to short-chain alcohol dehydrogenases)